MMRRLRLTGLLLIAAVLCPAPSWAGAPPAPWTPPRASGTYGNSVLLDGRAVGRVVESEINCVGHAAGLGSAVYLQGGSLEDLLEGLGYSCQVGDSGTLTDAIAADRPVMMVYLHMYPPEWREPRDRDLSYAQLAVRYGWSEETWRQDNAFYDADGSSLPLDYHAVSFNYQTGRWDWVARARDKSGDGSYAVDSNPFEPAAGDPDLYYPAPRVLVSLACRR